MSKSSAATNATDQELQLRTSFVDDVKGIIYTARENAVRSVDFERVQMYWRLGERIFVEEQGGQERAEYGSYLPKFPSRLNTYKTLL